MYSYIIDGGTFGPQTVTPRSGTTAARAIAAYHTAVNALGDAESALANATDKNRVRLAAAVETAREAVAKSAVKAKGQVKFTVPEGATVRRWNVDSDTARALVVASDSERAAIAATLGDAVETASAVHPSIAATDGFRSWLTENAPENATPGEFMLAMLASGLLVLPSSGKGPSAKGARKSADEKAAEAVAALFA